MYNWVICLHGNAICLKRITFLKDDFMDKKNDKEYTTTGLHMSDISQLLKILKRLVEQGSTVIVIEHNLDVISQADWIIDLGPFAGQNGGNVMFKESPKDLINCTSSITGKYLKKYAKLGE